MERLSKKPRDKKSRAAAPTHRLNRAWAEVKIGLKSLWLWDRLWPSRKSTYECVSESPHSLQCCFHGFRAEVSHPMAPHGTTGLNQPAWAAHQVRHSMFNLRIFS